jgi:hypothetical protein
MTPPPGYTRDPPPKCSLMPPSSAQGDDAYGAIDQDAKEEHHYPSPSSLTMSIRVAGPLLLPAALSLLGDDRVRLSRTLTFRGRTGWADAAEHATCRPSRYSPGVAVT